MVDTASHVICAAGYVSFLSSFGSRSLSQDLYTKFQQAIYDASCLGFVQGLRDEHVIISTKVQQRSGLKNLILEKKIDTVEEVLSRCVWRPCLASAPLRLWRPQRPKLQSCWHLPMRQAQNQMRQRMA